MKTVVIGSGSWGTGLGQVLCDNGREVIIYGNCKEQIDDIEQNHRNAMFFEDVQLNPDGAARKSEREEEHEAEKPFAGGVRFGSVETVLSGSSGIEGDP